MIYIASPYTHDLEAIRNLRYRQVLQYANSLMSVGHIVFSPVVYGHPFVELDAGAIPFSYWRPFNERIILASTQVRVLKLSGWKTSAGVNGEVRFADQHGIPVSFVEFDL